MSNQLEVLQVPALANTRQSRRDFLGAIAIASVALAGCSLADLTGADSGGTARMRARRALPSRTITPGTWALTEGRPRDGFLVVPSGYDPARAMPLIVALHGPGGAPTDSIDLLKADAEVRNILILAPGSRLWTWDAMSGPYGADVLFISGALAWTFDRCTVDVNRIMLQGFSDGASYALGLGVANGDVFTHIAANSPSLMPHSSSPAIGSPECFDSHGCQDKTTPIDGASRVIVPTLRTRGYDVDYIEFAGGHEVTPAIRTLMLDWFVA